MKEIKNATVKIDEEYGFINVFGGEQEHELFHVNTAEEEENVSLEAAKGKSLLKSIAILFLLPLAGRGLVAFFVEGDVVTNLASYGSLILASFFHIVFFLSALVGVSRWLKLGEAYQKHEWHRFVFAGLVMFAVFVVIFTFVGGFY